MSSLSSRIKLLRNEAGMTQSEFGELFGVTKSTISLYESGKSTPDDDIKAAICDHFEVSFDYLLGRTDYRYPIETRAAHATAELTEEEIAKVDEYVAFLKSQRKN